MNFRKSIFVFFLFMTAAINCFSQPVISKVEPPSWWINHTINPVRLFVRGENLANAKIVSKTPSLKISNFLVNYRADYVVFDVTISPKTKPGKHEFEITTPKGKTTIPFEVFPPVKMPQNVTNDDVIYLIMTDRFSNGDKNNDSNIDTSNPRMWHGGDFRGIINNLNYLQELGITAIWLTPWYDNSDEITNCDKPWCPMSSYHGYGAIDYYGVENHHGTLDDLRELITKANSKGIKVIQDHVSNHIGFRHPWVKKQPLDNWIPTFTQNRFNNSVLLSPNGSPAEKENVLRGWFDFTLPDLNQWDKEVSKYLIQNSLWWIGTTGINGIRQDTIQYMPRFFIRDWSSAIQKQYPNYYIVGEVFERDSAHTAFFQGGKPGWDGIDTNLPSVFDFKLWQTSLDVFTGKKPVRELREVLKYDGLYPNINRVTVLANNHDTERFMSLQGATKEGAKLHLAFVLATRGIPQLYYGEEVLMTGGHDPDNRRDFTKADKSSRSSDEQEMFEWTQKWIKFRKENRALREGKTVDLFYDNEVYVFERIIDEESVILAFNFSDKPRSVGGFKHFKLPSNLEVPAKSVIYKILKQK